MKLRRSNKAAQPVPLHRCPECGDRTKRPGRCDRCRGLSMLDPREAA